MGTRLSRRVYKINVVIEWQIQCKHVYWEQFQDQALIQKTYLTTLSISLTTVHALLSLASLNLQYFLFPVVLDWMLTKDDILYLAFFFLNSRISTRCY